MEYSEKFAAIRNFTNLGIRSKKNFTRREKWLISRYYNILKGDGYIEYDRDKNKYTQKSKFIPSKKSNVKGAPKVKGRFVRGAKPSDKISRSGKIIRENYTKTFIPLNFSDAITEGGEDGPDEEMIYETLFEALTPYFDEIKRGDYFTIVLENGHEIGQNQRAGTPKSKRREGRAYTKGLQPDDKLNELSYQIAELLRRAINKYKISNLIKGVFLWQFTNQRQPTRKEKKIIKKKR